MSELLEALVPRDRASLERTCQVLGIPLRTWRRVSWLRVQYEVLAVEAEAERIGGPRETAVMEACTRLGLTYETHRSRVGRVRRDAYDPSQEQKGAS